MVCTPQVTYDLYITLAMHNSLIQGVAKKEQFAEQCMQWTSKVMAIKENTTPSIVVCVKCTWEGGGWEVLFAQRQ